MQGVDRVVGAALAVLAVAVIVSASQFPDVPGQKVGAGFLPLLVGVGLLFCGLALVWRSRGAQPAAQARAKKSEQVWPAMVVMAACAGYILAADTLGFLIVAPLMLLAVFKALRVGWLPALAWAVGGSLMVHLMFYKLLRVPLPWGVFRPWY